ncbi:MAG: DNA repair protein RecO [bacterium]|nr:DNA repair protein RecO [bacterium]
MFLYHRTQGFVLKKENRGEADQLFTVFTKDFGKIVVLAKAVRKPSSKLRGAIDVFYLSEIEFIQGKIQKTLTGALLVENFFGIRKNLLKLRLAYSFSKIFCGLVRDQESDDNLWLMLKKFFFKLNQEELVPAKASLFYHFFFWKFLSLLGYRPELDKCLYCRKQTFSAQVFWAVKEGGLVCKNCLNKVKTKVGKLDAGLVKTLKIFLDQDWEALKALKIEPEPLQDLKIISRHYLYHIFEGK